MKKTIQTTSLIFGVISIAAETLILWKTDKFYPLSIDDYLVAIVLVVAFFKVKTSKQFLVYPITWAFVCGNMYAMLFGRLDPVYGSGQRIELLIGVNILAAVMLGLSLKVYINNPAAK